MTDWKEPGWDLPPVAAGTGPFCRREFLQVISKSDPGRPLVVTNGNGLLPFRETEGSLAFIGDPDLTDYHSPLGEGVAGLVAGLLEDTQLDRAEFDSLPAEAVDDLVAGFEAAGWSASTDENEVAAVLALPEAFDAYLALIGKKERHEVRRKRRRYERMVGETLHETHHGEGWAFDEFSRLHRLAPGKKGEFLTEERLEVFRRLAGLDGWRLDLLRTPNDAAAAVVFGYSDTTGYYLYNSAYDPELSDASPGVVLLGSMIEMAISEKLGRFDFLKGDEAYKFRLGAEARPLSRIQAQPARSS